MAKGVVFGGLNSGGGSIIKNAQHGLTTLGINDIVKYVDISPVDMSKAVVMVSANGTINENIANTEIKGQIYNPTQIQLRRGDGSYATKARWQVIEFENVKSLQRGDTASNAADTTVTINPVELTKSILFVSCYGSIYAGRTYQSWGLTANDKITLSLQSLDQIYFHWQVVEFN